MGAKRKRMQDKLDYAEATIERQRESIEDLRASNAKLRSRPNVAATDNDLIDVYTVMVANVEMQRGMLPIGAEGGYVRYVPGAIQITFVCTGPQPDSNPSLMEGGTFALVPVPR